MMQEGAVARFRLRMLILAAAIASIAMLGGCVYYPGYGYGYGYGYPYGYAYPYGYSYAYAPTFSFAVGGWGGGWNDHYWHGGRWGWYH